MKKGDARSLSITVRLSDEEMKKLISVAEWHERTLADTIRFLIKKDFDAKTVREEDIRPGVVTED